MNEKESIPAAEDKIEPLSVSREGATEIPKIKITKPRTGRFIGVSCLLVGCFVAAFLGSIAANSQTQSSTLMGAKNDGNKVVTQTEQDISEVVNKVSPAVVSVVTSQVQDDYWYGAQEVQGAGSGMIVSKDGYVLTNKHVVEGSTKATITLSSGKTYKDVPVLGVDPLNDIAFLKIPGVNDLPMVEIGDSKTVRTGQQVVAIGNALGEYQNSVTSGIISGLGRPVSAESEGGEVETLADLLQTDAAINSGNSGGPLLNMQGQVIGINTAVAADAQNIGFAIPIGAAKGMLNHVIATGKVVRAIVGIQSVTITPEIREQYNLSVDKGDYIMKVGGITNSVAEQAGIKEKDIVTKVNGIEVSAGKSTSTLVAEFQPGDTVTLTIVRGNKTMDIKLELGGYSYDSQKAS